jgi:NAD(P)-dependent dehydrogenase (short-subunit alcohol dehydrogenase family)
MASSVLYPSSMAVLGGAMATLVLAAGQFDNHLWRILCVYLSGKVLPCFDAYLSQAWYGQWALSLIVNAAIWWIPHLRPKHKRAGCVIITGADSGMGQATVLYLAETNNDNDGSRGHYDRIFAAAFNAKAAQASFEQLLKDKKDKLKYIQVISLDVTKEDTVKQAAATVTAYLKEKKSFLSGVVCYHGIAFNGPLSYIPMSIYQTQMDVNFFGNVRICQAFLPLLKATENATNNFRRLVFTGTGGGPCTPCPPLLTSYMSSKFAGEAMAQALKQELFMTQGDGPTIDVSVSFTNQILSTHLAGKSHMS